MTKKRCRRFFLTKNDTICCITQDTGQEEHNTMAGQDQVRVRAAVVEKDGKIDYLYEQGDIDYYVQVLGWRIIDWEDLYI